MAKRKIDYRIVDDAYNPAQNVQAVRRLVEQDKVFAVFNTLGAEANLAVRDYLNQVKVQQLFVASGATTWGRDAAKSPWTIGFQPSYAAEGLVYGQYIAKAKKKAKVAVLFSERRLREGPAREPEARARSIRREGRGGEAYEVTSPDVCTQIAKLKASGANVFCIVATPTVAIQAYVFAKRLGWKPLVINNAVSGTSNIMVLAYAGGKTSSSRARSRRRFSRIRPTCAGTRTRGMKQYRTLLAKYAQGANPNDVYDVYGMAVAYETVGLLRRLGANPTRTALVASARSISSANNPFLLPGVSVNTGKGDNLPIPAGPAPALDEGPLRAVGRPLDLEAES